MSEPSPDRSVASSLDSLAWAGGFWLWKSRLRDGLRARLPQALALLLVVPTLAIAIVGLGWVFGQAWKLPPGLVAFLFPLPTLFYLGSHAVRLWRRQPERREGLAVFDEVFDLQDRLQTADEFLAVAEPSPFMEAAIVDARPAVERAGRSPLEWDWGQPWGEWPRLVAAPIAALILLVVGLLLPPAARSGDIANAPAGGPAEASAALPDVPDTTPAEPERLPLDPPAPKPEPPEELVRSGAKGKPAPAKKNEDPSSELSGRDKISKGSSEGGQTSQAASAGRASQSSGMPGSQAPASNPEEQRPARKKDNKNKEEKPSKKDEKKVEDQSGATAGRGSSGGSSRNPASSDWASKDRTETADNEDFEQEEEVDDEDSESDARGGLQPNLRDRRPPVNRDLSIGFGNQSSPDANGRGGPGERKKSRGVASLVLGVPIPDHIKGQANPGRVKVNQERVQPQAETMPEGTAEDRGRRNLPAGYLSERTLDAPMRQVVRDFFLRTRAAEGGTTESETPNE